MCNECRVRSIYIIYETAEDTNSIQRTSQRIYHIEHNCCSASPQNKEQGFLWINLQHISIRSLNINVSTSRSSDCILYKYHRAEYTRPHSTHLKSIHN